MTDTTIYRSTQCAAGNHGLCLASGCRCGCHRPLTPELTWRILEFLLSEYLDQLQATLPLLGIAESIRAKKGLPPGRAIQELQAAIVKCQDFLSAGPE